METPSYLDWAVAATPDYLWVGSFYVQNGSSFVYASMVQKVDRKTLTAIANVTLPDHMFLDHIMLSGDNRLVYVNVYSNTPTQQCHHAPSLVSNKLTHPPCLFFVEWSCPVVRGSLHSRSMLRQ